MLVIFTPEDVRGIAPPAGQFDVSQLRSEGFRALEVAHTALYLAHDGVELVKNKAVPFASPVIVQRKDLDKMLDNLAQGANLSMKMRPRS